MASTIKLKFAGFVRGLLRQLDDSESARHVAPPAPSTPPMATPPQTPNAAPAEHVSPALTSDSSTIELPLAPIIAALPMDLKAKLMASPQAGQTIRLSVDAIVSQLAFGAVKIAFGELRQLAPGIFANSGGEQDSRQFNLPLQEILLRINPALLARRSVHKVSVAEEVSGPFDGRGRGVTFTSQPLKPPTAVPPPAGLSHPVAFTPPAKPPGNGATNGHGNGHLNTGLPAFKFSAAPASPAPAASSAPRPEPAQPTLLVSLDDLAENWPDELKQEIMQANLANVSTSLPLSLIEPGLRKGRVTMTWKEVRTLAKPSSAPSANDGMVLDLPLKVLAPAYLAAQKKLGRSQSKVAVSAEIPNLFFGFPQSAPSAPAAAPAPALAMAPAPAAITPKQADTNFFGLSDKAESPRVASPATDFLSRQMHPKEVVAQAMALPGVAGAVVTLADGLRVASEVPAELNPDTIAAFLPQIYERVNQSTRELRMGLLNNVSFTVGNVSWKIFRVNSIYFAAFGRAGEILPKSKLAALAAELDRKKQQ